MSVLLERFSVLIPTLILSCNAFWWSSTPTTEPTPTVKHVPLAYFRTFTYHPYSYPAAYINYVQQPYPSMYQNWPQNEFHYKLNANNQQSILGPKIEAPVETTTSSTTTPKQFIPAETPKMTHNVVGQAANFLSDNFNAASQATKVKSSRERSDFQYYPGDLTSFQQIRYVPCACPITVAVTPENPEKRSNADADADSEDVLAEETDSFTSHNGSHQ